MQTSFSRIGKQLLASSLILGISLVSVVGVVGSAVAQSSSGHSLSEYQGFDECIPDETGRCEGEPESF